MATDGFIILRHMVGFSRTHYSPTRTWHLSVASTKNNAWIWPATKVLDINGDGLTLTTDGLSSHVRIGSRHQLSPDDDMVDAPEPTEMAQLESLLRRGCECENVLLLWWRV